MKQRSKLKRSRLVRRPAGAAALFVLLLLPLSPPARANSSNLLPNGSFQSATSGWTPSDAVLTIASDGGVAGYAIYRDDGASAAPSDAVTTAQPQSSAVGLWHLDELSGTTAYDSSGHGHNGAISGPVTLGVPGELNTAYSFVPKSTVIVPDAPQSRTRDGGCHDLVLAELDDPAPVLQRRRLRHVHEGGLIRAKVARSKSKSRRTGRRRACSAARSAGSNWQAGRA